MTARACILGCSGPELTSDETAFFRDVDPWGFILFKRNIDNPDQVRALTASLRACVGRTEAPVLIDQEGGRVQRMGPPHWRRYPPGRAYSAPATDDALAGRELARLGARLIAHDLLSVGINVDCLPVLDVPASGAHDIIGDRAYASDPRAIAVLGRAAAEGLLAGGVLPVIKHMPGHGRAGADSHEALPVVDASREELEQVDFEPFRVLADMPLGMSAHVVYTAVDPERPATTSPVVIGDVIRGSIGFDGLLMSDDLSMKALAGSLGARAEAALAAGCDVALHCNGQLAEMREVAAAAPALSGDASRRAAGALARLRHRPEPLDPVDAHARFAAALAAVS
jgi:beta-N-acetylhexosaminidase